LILHYDAYNFEFDQLLNILELNKFRSLIVSINQLNRSTSNVEELSAFKQWRSMEQQNGKNGQNNIQSFYLDNGAEITYELVPMQERKVFKYKVENGTQQLIVSCKKIILYYYDEC